jgi:4-amino-4-deoxy-L-arabinose transferase-like glycosyltransferase
MKILFQSRPLWLVLCILLLALGGTLRLIDVDDPPLDFQPSRQLRNSLVAREIYYSLLPTASEQVRELTASFARSVGQYEPPVIETIVALTYFITAGESIAVARIWESLFWLVAGVALFDLARRAISPWAALVALTYYLVLPFSVQASRSFQPDPLMTASFVAGIYFLYLWSESANEGSWKWAILAGIFLGLATLVKIVIAFFAGAAAVALVWFALGRDFWRSKQVWVMAALMVVPAFLYYILLNTGRSTEYFFAWTVTLLKLVTSTDFYSKWLAFLGSLFGLTIIVFSMAGAVLAAPRLRWLLVSLWVGYILYGLTLPFQMYTHSYYHIQLIPIVAWGLAVAVNPLLERAAGLGVVWRAAFVGVIAAAVGYQAWVARSVLVAEDFRHEPAFWREVGEVIPADANVIGLTQDYGFRLMMWGWRKVNTWPLVTDLSEAHGGTHDAVTDFTDLAAGKDYFLVTAFGQLDKQPDLRDILEGYPIAAQGDGYVLYDLRK